MTDENQTAPTDEQVAEEVKAQAAADAEALQNLKARATSLGISFRANIGAEALANKIAAHLSNEEEEQANDDPAPAEDVPLSPMQLKAKLRAEARAEAMKLVRCRITCMNPDKADLHGEIFTVANKLIGNVTKFIPFGDATNDGYHIPNVLYKNLKNRKFLQVRTRARKGNSADIEVKQNWVPEFSIEVLPTLTEAELEELKAAQAAKGGIA